MFCSETDLLLFEPALLTASLALVEANTQPHTVAFSGSGTLAGDLLTCDTGTFTQRQIGPGSLMVVQAGGGTLTLAVARIGAGATELVLSRLLPGLWRGTQADQVIVSGSFDATWQQVVFPQIGVVGAALEEAFGVEPTAVIMNAKALRRVCALGSLAHVFRTLGAFERNLYGGGGVSPGTAVASEYRRLAEAYALLFKAAVRGVRLELDTNGDGRTDEVRRLDAPAIERM